MEPEENPKQEQRHEELSPMEQELVTMFRSMKASFFNAQKMLLLNQEHFSNFDLTTGMSNDEVTLLRLLRSGGDFEISPIGAVMGNMSDPTEGTYIRA